MPRRRYSISVDVQAPPARVWEIVRDVERWHEWTASIRSIMRRDDGPFRIGSTALVRQPRLPPAVWTVTDLQDGRSFTWENRSPGIRSIGRHAVEPAAGGTRASLSIEFIGWLAPLFAMLFGGLTERYIGLEAAGLKRRGEAAVSETGGVS